MSGTASISGVISGLQTDQILEQLRQIESAAVRRLQARQAELNEKLSIWQNLNTDLVALKTAASDLSLASGLAVRTATVSDESALAATVSGYPAVGQTSFTIVALAAVHQIASQGYADCDTTLIGTGSVTINGEQIVTDGLTLNGLRDAINATGAGVHASIVDTGDGAAPYRLVLTSDDSGLAGEIQYSVSVSGANAPTFTTVQAAQDAHIRFGSGESAIDVYRSTNYIDDVIPGLELTLKQTTAGPVTVSVATDTEGITEKVRAFVEAYNAVMSFINEQSEFDSTNNTSPPLFGDFNMIRIQDDLHRMFSSPVEGAPPELSLLSQVGLRRDVDGQITFDESAFASALNADPDGVTRLFASAADCPAGVTFVSSTNDTQPSGAAGYSLEVTQAATRGWVTAGVAMGGPLTADETLTINGVTIVLAAGSTLAEVVDAINNASSQTGVIASATASDGTGTGSYLTLRRSGYGSSLGINAYSDLSNQGADVTTGLGNVTVTDDSPGGESGTGVGASGLDVEGYIDGVFYQGSGRTLKADSGDAAGLTLIVSAGVGVHDPIIFTRGTLTTLSQTLSSLLDEQNGAYQTATGALESGIEALDDEIAHAEETVEAKMARVSRQFQAMEAALARLQSQSSMMTSMLASLEANTE